MKSYTLLLSLAVLFLFGACKKEDDNGMYISVNYPVANVGDELNFAIANDRGGISGVRWNMGDGTATFSGFVTQKIHLFSPRHLHYYGISIPEQYLYRFKFASYY